MKRAALLLVMLLGGAALAACEDTYDNGYGYENSPGYYHHDYYGRGYYDSYGYWHPSSRYYCSDPDHDCD